MPTSLLIACVICPLAYCLFLTNRPASVVRTFVKMFSVGLLVCLSWSYNAPVLLIAALLFGTLGDGFLSREGDRYFLAGLASFLLGHICFTFLFLQLNPEFSLLPDEPLRIGMAAILVILAAGVSVNLRPFLGPLLVPVYLYVIISLVMGFAALALPQSWPILLVTIGAMLFIFSDVILAYDLFVIPAESDLREYTSRILWTFYWGGQFLIFLGTLQSGFL